MAQLGTTKYIDKIERIDQSRSDKFLGIKLCGKPRLKNE